MELHLFEKDKQNLVYNLPIHKASMDNRIECALDLIEQRKVLLLQPDQSNYEYQEEEKL
jgi:vancomycin permeability regulator SanA